MNLVDLLNKANEGYPDGFLNEMVEGGSPWKRNF